MTDAGLREQPQHGTQPPPAFTGKYLSITSYKRDGTAVATPVWFVSDAGRLLAVTDADSYKVKRIRHNPAVTIYPCTATGRLRGAPVTAHAVLLDDSQTDRVEQLIAHKYRADIIFIKPIRALQAAVHLGRPRGKSVVLAITPE
jgi:uncharacterized protein